MNRPRKVTWLKPSCRVFKALAALDAAGGQMPHAVMSRVFAGLYESAGAMGSAQTELIRSGLLERVVVLTDAGRAAIQPKPVPVKRIKIALPDKAQPVQQIKAAPPKPSGVGSTGAAHAWRGRKAVTA